MFENAEKYLKAHLNGQHKIPLAVRKAEREKFTVQKNGLYQEFYRRKEEVHKAELIQKAVQHMVRTETKDIRSISPVKKQSYKYIFKIEEIKNIEL